ncbi:MAG: terminase large subunit [Candidatus Aminicenantales bacterium]|jgi:hypothetical protein
MAQCQALRVDGRPCGMKALRGEPFCVRHSEKTSPRDIIEAMFDRRAFGKQFHDPATWSNWVVCLKAIYGLPLTPLELEVFRTCTGRMFPRTGGYEEVFIIAGRQGGKSTTMGFVAAYEAALGGWEMKVGPGEQWNIFCLADTREQAGIVFGNIKRFLGPFQRLVRRETNDELDLVNGAHIAVKASDFRSVRGWRLALVVLDEVGFFPNDNVDELVSALTPSIIPGGRLIGISSPNRKAGPLWALYEKFWGRDDADTLIFKAPTKLLNPTFSDRKIARDMERDPERCRAEYEAVFRDDIGALFDEEKLRAAAKGSETPPEKGMKYVAFIDASAGRADSMTLAIAHAFQEMVYLDLVRENVPPFDFVQVVEEYAGLLREYGIHECWGDRYAFASLESQLRRHRIALSQSKASATEFYLKLKALLQAGAVVLLNDRKLIDQLMRLEIQTLPSGAERIDHPKNANDDVASAAAGAIYHVCKGTGSRQPTPGLVVQRHEHPDMQREKELQAKDELADCEREMMEYIADGGGLGIPIQPGREFIPVKRP